MPRERSPPRTGPDVPDAQPVGVLRTASPLQRHDPKQGFSWASQLLSVRRCDDHLNPPHHLRVIRRPPHPVAAIRPIKRRQIHPLDRVEHKPCQMPLRKPLPDIRRHQKRLITTTTNKVLSHPQMVLNPPDNTELCDTLV
jgi:hypothetical protein